MRPAALMVPVLSFVMESGLQGHKVIAVNQVDQPVFFADPPRPGSRKHVAEWLGLADPGRRVAQCVVDQAVDPFERCPGSPRARRGGSGGIRKAAPASGATNPWARAGYVLT